MVLKRVKLIISLSLTVCHICLRAVQIYTVPKGLNLSTG